MDLFNIYESLFIQGDMISFSSMSWGMGKNSVNQRQDSDGNPWTHEEFFNKFSRSKER